MKKRILGIFLIICMLFSSMSVSVFAGQPYATTQTDSADSAYTVQSLDSTPKVHASAVTPTMVVSAIDTFAKSLDAFTKDTSNLVDISVVLTRFGGVTSFVSGGIAILQMIGVIKDPTFEMLGKIYDEVLKVEKQIEALDTRLDSIHKELTVLAVRTEEITRSDNATDMIKTWNNFGTNYCEPLDDKMNEYEGKINGGIKSWWELSSHDSVRVLYTSVDGKPSITYSSSAYDSGFPETSDNGEEVLADESFGVPSEYIPDTKGMTFNINTYREVFAGAMAASFIDAANNRQLDAADAFYNSWSSLSQNDKAEKAKNYAEDILNTYIHRISCDVMSNNDEWVISVMNAYRNFCSNVNKPKSGIDAMLNAMYLSHGFEGEIKDDLETFCQGMIVKAGYYGQFAMACAGQDSMQSEKNRKEMRDLFAETVNNLNEKKGYAITGHDNFCYVTGTLVSCASADLKAKTAIEKDDNLYNIKADEWKAALPSMLNNVYSQVLYHQYQAEADAGESFTSYLNKNGTGMAADYSGLIMTQYNGSKNFELSEDLEVTMKNYLKCAIFENADDSYLNNQDLLDYIYRYRADTAYKTGSMDLGNDLIAARSKAVFEGINVKTGALVTNQQAARLVYSHFSVPIMRTVPELFSTSNVTEKIVKTGGNFEVTHSVDVKILELTPVHDLNGDADENDPFFAFGGLIFTDGVSDVTGISISDERTPLTDVILRNNNFAYTGSTIRPKVTVKAGDVTVSSENYSVSYGDNIEPGIGSITVTAQGDEYSGTIAVYFNITSDASTMTAAAKNIKVKYSRLKKKAQTKTAISVTGSKGAVSYQLLSVKKGGKSYKKYIKVNTSTGKVKIRKGLKKGTYKVKVNVTDAGSAAAAGTTQTVTFKVKVR